MGRRHLGRERGPQWQNLWIQRQNGIQSCVSGVSLALQIRASLSALTQSKWIQKDRNYITLWKCLSVRCTLQNSPIEPLFNGPGGSKILRALSGGRFTLSIPANTRTNALPWIFPGFDLTPFAQARFEAPRSCILGVLRVWIRLFTVCVRVFALYVALVKLMIKNSQCWQL